MGPKQRQAAGLFRGRGCVMLVVSRQRSESIRIGDDIRVTVRSIRNDHVVLAVEYNDGGSSVKR